MNAVVDKCTLVYTLTGNELGFDDFHLIIRSLHSYKVERIVPLCANKKVEVYLAYNANLANVRTKMGDLCNIITVEKSNPFVESGELDRLSELRQRYNFGGGAACEDEGPSSRPFKKPKYKKSS